MLNAEYRKPSCPQRDSAEHEEYVGAQSVGRPEEGSPQRGPLSPLLANIYLNEYDQEMARRGIPVIHYADGIVVLAKSPRAAQRLLENTQRYLEGKLKLRMNMEKSHAVGVFSKRNFKFLGFALRKGKNGVYIRAMQSPSERPKLDSES